jgi:hypothetical protein
MHDRPANEVTMEKNSARLSGRALASADTFRRSLAWTSLSHLIRAALPAVAPYLGGISLAPHSPALCGESALPGLAFALRRE